MDVRKLRLMHRWIALAFSVSALMATGSGVFHVIMSRTQAPPPPARPADSTLDVSTVAFTPAQAVAKLTPPPGKLQAINLRGVAGEPWYQVYAEHQPVPVYVNAKTGAVDEKRDEAYAARIASDFLNGADVKKTAYLTSYNAEYVAIFRILPVYRMDCNDGKGTRVYVSTVTGSVTRHTNDAMQLEAGVFWNLHKLGFIKNRDLRDALISFTTFGIFVVSVMGIWLFFATMPKKKPASSGAGE